MATVMANATYNIFDNRSLAFFLSSRGKATVVIEASICVILNILAIVSNALLCWAVYKNPRLRRVTNIYVLSLAVTDLATAVVVIPFLCSVSINGRWISTWLACQFQGYWSVVLAYTAQLLLSLTAINRCVRVVRPQLYARLFIKKYVLISIAFVTVLACCSPLPYILRGHQFAFHPGMMICFYTIENSIEKQALFRIVFFTILPMFIVTCCYLRIFGAVRRHARRLQSSDAAMSSNNLSLEDIQMIRTLFAIIFTFFICWTPLYVIAAIDTAYNEFRLPRQVYFFATYLVGLSTIANPIIFSYMNATFRGECSRLLKAIGLRRTEVGHFEG